MDEKNLLLNPARNSWIFFSVTPHFSGTFCSHMNEERLPSPTNTLGKTNNILNKKGWKGQEFGTKTKKRRSKILRDLPKKSQVFGATLLEVAKQILK